MGVIGRSEHMYLSGPISGQNGRKVWDNFGIGEKIATERGFIPVNPLRIEPILHDGPCPVGRKGMGGHNEACHFRADLRRLLGCEAMLLLPGWAHSWGVRLELQIATTVGMQIWETMPGQQMYPLNWDPDRP